MSSSHNNLEVKDIGGSGTDQYDRKQELANQEYGFGSNNAQLNSNSAFKFRKSKLRSPNQRNYPPNRHTSPHITLKRSLQPINISKRSRKEAEPNSESSELEKLRQTIRFLSMKLQERDEAPYHPEMKQKLMLTELTWLKKALKEEQQQNQLLRRQFGVEQSSIPKQTVTSRESKVNNAKTPLVERRTSQQEVLSNNLKIERIQEEMASMRQDVSRLKDVIIEQRVYISELEIELGILREMQGSQVGTVGWPYLQNQQSSKRSQIRSSPKGGGGSFRNASLPH